MSTAARRHTISNTTQPMDADMIMMVLEEEGMKIVAISVFALLANISEVVVSDGGVSVLALLVNISEVSDGGVPGERVVVIIVSGGQVELL